MSRVPLKDKSDLQESYEIIQRKRENLAEDIDADFWNRQPTVQAFSNNPELGEAHLTANTVMWTETGLTDTESECVIMTVARELECELLWHDHVGLAVENDRLSESQIRDIADGETEAFDDKLTTLIEYTREYVTERGQIRDRTHDSLSAYYDDETLVGVVMLAGFYVSLSHEVQALGLQREGFVGWELERYQGEA